MVCLERPRSVLFPCGHFACCAECTETIRRGMTKLCPMCRQRISFKTIIGGVKMV